MTEESEAALEFLAEVQHNLRTPLTSVLALSDLALDNWDRWSAEERTETFRDIRVAAEQILRLSDRLDDSACLPGGVIDIAPQTVTWGSMCNVVIAGRLPRDHCRLTLSGDLDVEFKVDRPRMVQLITELLDNACRYAGAATIVAAVSDTTTELVVSDTGPGISPRVQARLGEPFVFGTPPPGAHFHGLGLGLLVARRIAEAHGGSLSIESSEAGTVATVRLPRI